MAGLLNLEDAASTPNNLLLILNHGTGLSGVIKCEKTAQRLVKEVYLCLKWWLTANVLVVVDMGATFNMIIPY